jgi:hypothetical protein
VTEAMGIGDIGVSLWGECERQDGMHLGGAGIVHPELIDAETGELVEVSLTRATIARYRERLDRWCHDVEAFCARRGIRYARVSTDTPFEDLLLDTLRRGLILK